MDKEKKNGGIKWYSYLALILLILYFSGIFTHVEGPLRAIDFTNTLGEFGVMGKAAEDGSIVFAKNFKGIGGYGVRDGFLLIVTVIPGIMLAYAVIECFIAYGGEKAAEKIFTPILRPLLGLPGSTAPAIIANLSSADAGSSIAKTLVENGDISEQENLILSQWLFGAPAVLVNLFSVATPLSSYIPKPLSYALVVIIIVKILQAQVCRIYAKYFMK